MYFTDISLVVHPVGRITSGGVKLLGTSFFINKIGLVATAAHVVENKDNNLVIIKNRVNSLQHYQDTSINRVSYIPATIKAINPICDVCILETQENIQSTFELCSTDDVSVGESISLFGYPHSDYGRMVLTQQNSSVGAKIYIDSFGVKVKNLVLNIQSRPGQSGSPILVPEKNMIAGILIGSYAPHSQGGIDLAGVDPHTLHQTTHAVSIEYIKEML